MKSVYLRKIFIMINFQGIFAGIHAPPPPRKYFQNLLGKVYYNVKIFWQATSFGQYLWRTLLTKIRTGTKSNKQTGKAWKSKIIFSIKHGLAQSSAIRLCFIIYPDHWKVSGNLEFIRKEAAASLISVAAFLWFWKFPGENWKVWIFYIPLPM